MTLDHSLRHSCRHSAPIAAIAPLGVAGSKRPIQPQRRRPTSRLQHPAFHTPQAASRMLPNGGKMPPLPVRLPHCSSLCNRGQPGASGRASTTSKPTVFPETSSVSPPLRCGHPGRWAQPVAGIGKAFRR